MVSMDKGATLSSLLNDTEKSCQEMTDDNHNPNTPAALAMLSGMFMALPHDQLERQSAGLAIAQEKTALDQAAWIRRRLHLLAQTGILEKTAEEVDEFCDKKLKKYHADLARQRQKARK